MTHLIIGSGNMGLRHMRTLLELGQIVNLVDLEFNVKLFNWSKWKPVSVLICTPSETHAQIINEIPMDIPVFCEKPLIVNLKQKIAARQSPTLMACNWTWCQCIKNSKTLDLLYPSNDKHRDLDYIHFSLLPKLDVNIRFTKELIYSCTDKGEIHKEMCRMFYDQMKHWLRVIVGKEKSRLDFETALKYNIKLLQ